MDKTANLAATRNEPPEVTGAFLQEFEKWYLGVHDPLDALWWMDHPLEAGPSGALPPGYRAIPLLVIARTSPAARAELRGVAENLANEANLTISAVHKTQREISRSSKTVVSAPITQTGTKGRKRIALMVTTAIAASVLAIGAGLSGPAQFLRPSIAGDSADVPFSDPEINQGSSRLVAVMDGFEVRAAIGGTEICIQAESNLMILENCVSAAEYIQRGVNLSISGSSFRAVDRPADVTVDGAISFNWTFTGLQVDKV